MEHEAKSFCRLCLASCGMIVTTNDAGRLLRVRGDHEHRVTQGYACFTGLQSPDAHNSPDRLLHPLKRMTDGSFAPIAFEQAVDEIAEKLRVLVVEHGPAAVAGFRGTANYPNVTAAAMLPAWLSALGSPAFFSTMTVDQSAKWVSVERLGTWAAGRDNFADSDVILLIGGNPLVSGTVLGFPCANPVKQIKQARARGMTLIVIDPRMSETAKLADIVLQPLPGEDAAIAAGLLNIILSEGWEDREFCDRHVDDLDALRAAVAPFTPEWVAERAGVGTQELRRVAEAFAHIGRRGFAVTGTGPNMGPHSNLAEHLIECLNVVCGRFRRAGDAVVNPVLLGPRQPRHAQVVPPGRSWEKGHRSRIRDTGTIFGEMMTCVLADEILTPGPGQIRSLFVVGGNPVGAFPDPGKTRRAMAALDLLVTIDPFMTETARRSHYIFPPRLQYERADVTGIHDLLPAPYYQYTRAVASPPAGSAVIDEWRLFWELAKRLDMPLVINGVPLDPDAAMTTEALLAIQTRHAQVPREAVLASENGTLVEDHGQVVQPAAPGEGGRFAVMPTDVRQEIEAAFRRCEVSGYRYRLSVRRTRGVINTAYHHLPGFRRRQRYNPAYLNPGELAASGLSSGDRVTVVSPYGRIRAIVEPDAGLRPGVLSMSHGWGSRPDEDVARYEEGGSSTSALVSADDRIEPINAMVQLTGVPVNIEAGWAACAA